MVIFWIFIYEFSKDLFLINNSSIQMKNLPQRMALQKMINMN